MIDILCSCGEPSIFQIVKRNGESKYFCHKCFVNLATVVATKYNEPLKDLLDTIRKGTG